MISARPPIRINRTPVLTLLAMAIAEPLDCPYEAALTFGQFVPGPGARAKTPRLWGSEATQKIRGRHARAAELKPCGQAVPGRATRSRLGRRSHPPRAV